MGELWMDCIYSHEARLVIVAINPDDRDSIGYPLLLISTENEEEVISAGGLMSPVILILSSAPATC